MTIIAVAYLNFRYCVRVFCSGIPMENVLEGTITQILVERSAVSTFNLLDKERAKYERRTSSLLRTCSDRSHNLVAVLQGSFLCKCRWRDLWPPPSPRQQFSIWAQPLCRGSTIRKSLCGIPPL